MDTLDPSLADHASILERVARALDAPVAEFIDERSVDEGDDLLALVRLWSKIEDNQGRRRVLDVARREAKRGSHKRRAEQLSTKIRQTRF